MADLPRESTRIHTLLRIDDRPIGDDRNEIRAFMTVRDEMLRLRQNLAHHRRRLRRAPFLTKIPFIRWLPGTRYVDPHATTPIRLSEITGVLLLFKFLERFFRA